LESKLEFKESSAVGTSVRILQRAPIRWNFSRRNCRHLYLGSFLDPESIRKLVMGPSGTLLKEQGSYNLI